MKRVKLSLFGLLLGPLAHAQIPAAGIYTQNFDSLASTGTTQTWLDNSTITGWYAAKDAFAEGQYIVRNGISNFSTLISYGLDTDRAAGFGNTGSFYSTSLAIRFANSTSQSISGLSVGFDGEQWGRKTHATPAADTLYFSYKIYTTSPGNSGLLNNTGWIDAPSLDFVSPNWSDPTAANLDGNFAGNRVSNINDVFSSLTLLPGQELWLRWAAYGESIGNHDLAIDNLTVSFGTIPEPATYGLVFAGLAATVAVFGRRIRM